MMSSFNKMCFVLKSLNKSVLKPLSVNRLTYSSSVVFRRFCHNQTTSDGNNGSVKDMESIFLLPKVKTLLHRLIGFDEKIVFANKPSIHQNSNEFRFMTDKELDLMLEMARNSAAEQLQMAPVLNPKEDNPRVLSKDIEIQGYIDSKVVFVDSSSGASDQTRIIVIREPNGVLREANREERYRLNQTFFPKEERLLETPKMFFEPHLQAVLDRHDYEFVLNRACLQFEPNDPKYIDICHKTYEHISDNNQFRDLHSTRHFGPLALYLAFNRKADKLLNYFILKEAISEASDLIQIYYIIHSNDEQLLEDIDAEVVDSLELVKKYINEESKEKPILELSLQKYEEIQKEKICLSEDIDRAHGLTLN